MLSNGGRFVLLFDTPDVQFGRRNPVEISNPLRGVNGVTVKHANGGRRHVFAFTYRDGSGRLPSPGESRLETRRRWR